jgi:hypothetical protein
MEPVKPAHVWDRSTGKTGPARLGDVQRVVPERQLARVVRVCDDDLEGRRRRRSRAVILPRGRRRETAAQPMRMSFLLTNSSAP